MRKRWSESLKRKRGDRGAVLAEGVVALALLITGTVGAALFLLNSGMMMYHKQRLGFIALKTADYACTLATPDLEKVKAFAKDISKQMGSNTDKLAVEVNDVTVGTAPGVRVEISNQFPLFESSVKLLPSFISLRDSAVSTKTGAGSFASLPGAGFVKAPLMYGNPPGQQVWIPAVSAGQFAPAEGKQYFLQLPLVVDPSPTPTGPPAQAPRR